MSGPKGPLMIQRPDQRGASPRRTNLAPRKRAVIARARER